MMKEHIIIALSFIPFLLSGFVGLYPPGCDKEAAAQCEYNFLYCRLFGGPANDPVTTCTCSNTFYGQCITEAGCLTSPQVSGLSKHQIYMKNCIDTIIENNCPSPLQCAINCASDGFIDKSTSKIIPFNNYGEYFLRIKICLHKVDQQKLSRYSIIDVPSCTKDSDFLLCNRWIPPLAFVPVALPTNTTYIEVDSCQYSNGNYTCLPTTSSVRIYGNQYLFPSSFNVATTNVSVCLSNDNCLGSFCDLHQRPPVCSPKSLRQIEQSGKYYFSDPFD